MDRSGTCESTLWRTARGPGVPERESSPLVPPCVALCFFCDGRAKRMRMKRCTKVGERTQARHEIPRQLPREERNETKHGFDSSGSGCHTTPNRTTCLILTEQIVARCACQVKSSTHIAVGISVAAEHRPTSLDGATSTHMVMYVTSRCGLELSFFLPTPAWLAGRTSSLKSPRSLRGKTSWRNFWLSQPRRAGGTSVIRSSKSYVTLSCDLGWHCIACAAMRRDFLTLFSISHAEDAQVKVKAANGAKRWRRARYWFYHKPKTSQDALYE